MILIDTSCWVESLRQRGDAAVRERVKRLVLEGNGAWCGMVRPELWAGVRDPLERPTLKQFEQVIPELSTTEEVWQSACDLAVRCREAGKTAPASDMVIAACARHHSVELQHLDRHFTFLLTL